MKKTLFIGALFILSTAAHAIDGVILIDQKKALAGNVTPGDAPGFPVTISTKGSYKLSADLTVPDAYTTGIEITAANVTIDLNGFGIYGPNECTGYPVSSCSAGGSGSGVTSNAVGTTVRNGVVRGMGNYGVYLYSGSVVENITASHNGSHGITVFGGAIRNCVAHSNFQAGIMASGGTNTVSGNTSFENRGGGIIAHGSTLVTGNSSSRNGSYGLVGSYNNDNEVGYSNNVLSKNLSGKGYGSSLHDLGGNL